MAEVLESFGLVTECLCSAGRGQVPQLLLRGAPASTCHSRDEKGASVPLSPSPLKPPLLHRAAWALGAPPALPHQYTWAREPCPCCHSGCHGQEERSLSGEAKTWEGAMALEDLSPVLLRCPRKGQEIIENSEDIL